MVELCKVEFVDETELRLFDFRSGGESDARFVVSNRIGSGAIQHLVDITPALACGGSESYGLHDVRLRIGNRSRVVTIVEYHHHGGAVLSLPFAGSHFGWPVSQYTNCRIVLVRSSGRLEMHSVVNGVPRVLVPVSLV